MNYTVYKYPLSRGLNHLMLPRDADLLSARVQDQKSPMPITLWALVYPDAPIETRYVFVVGTGYPVPAPKKARYVTTIQADGEQSVWHVFDFGTEPPL